MSACCTFFVLLESASEEGRYYFIELISCMYVLFGQKLGLFQFLIPSLFSVTVFTFSLFRKVFALMK